MTVLEESYGVVPILEIRCPVHGDVTSELVPKNWDGTATIVLLRQKTIHPGCGKGLFWCQR